MTANQLVVVLLGAVFTIGVVSAYGNWLDYQKKVKGIEARIAMSKEKAARIEVILETQRIRRKCK